MPKITKDVAQEILDRLRAGTTTLKTERERLNMKSNTTIRRAVTALLDGDKDAFHALVRVQRTPREPVS